MAVVCAVLHVGVGEYGSACHPSSSNLRQRDAQSRLKMFFEAVTTSVMAQYEGRLFLPAAQDHNDDSLQEADDPFHPDDGR